MNWLSTHEEEDHKESAPSLFKKLEREHIVKAIENYEKEKGSLGKLENIDEAHFLKHENQRFSPSVILAIACQFVDRGRKLEAGNLQGISMHRRFKPLEAAGFEIFPKTESPTARELFHLVRKMHVLKAIEEFEGGIVHDFGPSTQYDLIHQEKPYPPKAILGIACNIVNGGRLMKPSEFDGGENSDCFKTLKREGFKVIPKNSGETKNHGFEIEKLYPVLEIISKLKELWKSNRPKSDNKYAIIHLLEPFQDEKAIFRPYGPAWAASPWNRKVWVKENGGIYFNISEKFWLYLWGTSSFMEKLLGKKEAILLWDEVGL